MDGKSIVVTGASAPRQGGRRSRACTGPRVACVDHADIAIRRRGVGSNSATSIFLAPGQKKRSTRSRPFPAADALDKYRGGICVRDGRRGRSENLQRMYALNVTAARMRRNLDPVSRASRSARIRQFGAMAALCRQTPAWAPTPRPSPAPRSPGARRRLQGQITATPCCRPSSTSPPGQSRSMLKRISENGWRRKNLPR